MSPGSDVIEEVLRIRPLRCVQGSPRIDFLHFFVVVFCRLLLLCKCGSPEHRKHAITPARRKYPLFWNRRVFQRALVVCHILVVTQDLIEEVIELPELSTPPSTERHHRRTTPRTTPRTASAVAAPANALERVSLPATAPLKPPEFKHVRHRSLV